MYGQYALDIEHHGELMGDFSHTGLAVTSVPELAGGDVQLMDAGRVTVEDQDLPIDPMDIDICPALRVIRGLVHLYRSDALTRPAS